MQFDFDLMDMRLAEVYNSVLRMMHSSLSLAPLDLFDLKLHKEMLQQSITSKGVISKYKLLFSFQNTCTDFHISSANVLINDLRIECLEVDQTGNKMFVTEADLGVDSVCKFEAIFEFDSSYAPLKHTWPLPQVFKPDGVFVYSSKELVCVFESIFLRFRL